MSDGASSESPAADGLPAVGVNTVPLRQLALSRAGDKGDISNVSVIPYDAADYDWLVEQVTVARVAAVYGPLVAGDIVRYELPGIRALNFVMHGALEGGVSRTLAQDLHGKSRGALMGTIEVTPPR